MTNPQPFRVTWFSPDRPVEGNTVYVRPAPAVTWLSAPGWTTAHLARSGGERPLTVCGRVMRRPRLAVEGAVRCHYCQTVAFPPDRTRVFARGARLRAEAS